MKSIQAALVAAALIAFAAPASADTLYVASPPGQAPGHPMRLGADRRATQVGDLVQVTFNFNVNSTSSNVTSTNNNYSVGLNPGTGLANLPLVRIGANLAGGRQASTSKTQTGQNTFTSTMEAVVTNVLPSGALAIAGDQKLLVNGQTQVLHITGLVRPEDIDGTDTVLSDRVANVTANFAGNFQEKNNGLIRKLLDFLF
jgi:flagellar L-ring protein precursor FlgH